MQMSATDWLVIGGVAIAIHIAWRWFEESERRSRSRTAAQRRANAAARGGYSPTLHEARQRLDRKAEQAEEERRLQRQRNVESVVKPFALGYHALRAVTGREKREAERLMQLQLERED